MSEADATIRNEPLTEEVLGDDPLDTCARWLADAYNRSRMGLPNSVHLSTIGEDGWPQGRVVLVKSADVRGLVFFTNYRSGKARALAYAPRAALTFFWPDLHRQIRVRGTVERIDLEESDRYFRTRPRGSQIGAWASDQSEPLTSREALESRYRELEMRFAEEDVPRPDHWGGYLVRPEEIEFWQARDDRLHDRFVFRRNGGDHGGEWRVQRLSP